MHVVSEGIFRQIGKIFTSKMLINIVVTANEYENFNF